MSNSYAFRQEEHLVIGNNKVEAHIRLGEAPGLARLTNKGTDTALDFAGGKDFAFWLAASEEQAFVREWSFCVGSGWPVTHEQDEGFRSGYYQTTVDDESWHTVQRINDFPLGGAGYASVIYPGYGWYRSKIQLSAASKGQPLEFGIGGYDHEDWHQYWVYINGVLIGHARPEGRWHDAPKFILQPDDPRYECFHFGEPNTIAVQACGLDRSTPEMVISDSERYSIGSRLLDQYVSAGPAIREASGFTFTGIVLHEGTIPDAGNAKLTGYLKQPGGDVQRAQLNYTNDREGLNVAVHYWVNGEEAVLYKQIQVTNVSGSEQLLMELDLQRMSGDADVSAGGVGVPCTIGDEWFCVIRHPAGIQRGEGHSLTLSMLPGARLAPGESYTSKVAVFGAGLAGQAAQSFVQYLEKHGPRRRELLNVYNCYGIHDMAGIHEPTYMTEELVMSNLDDLEAFRKRDIRFDYYYFDAGWSNPNGDMTDFDPNYFPNGSAKVMERIHNMGMKIGLWTSPASGPAAFYPWVKAPELASCGSLPGREKGSDDKFRGALCIAAKPWLAMYRKGLLHHVKENKVSGFKLDGNQFCCTNPEHDHLPGKYSMEPIIDATIDTLEEVRLQCPDVMFMFYWNIQSPLWLLHGDTIYERGILMEGSTPADYPTRLLRQSITVSYDQAAHHAWDHVPLSSGDSLGVWISKWRWANYIGREGWQDAWVMEIARGSLLHQLWGDMSMFEADDVDFLAYMSAWVKKSAYLTQYPRKILGSPWKPEPYGYAYFEGGNGAVFVFNPTFEHATAELELGAGIGFSAAAGVQYYEVSGIYATNHAIFEPGQDRIASGETWKIALKPFEVRVLEVRPGNNSSAAAVLPSPAEEQSACEFTAVPFAETVREEIAWDDPGKQWEIRRMINGRALYVDSEEAFKQIRTGSDERDRAVTRRIAEAHVSVGTLDAGRTLLVGASLSRESIYWHHHALFDIVKLKVVLDGEELPVKTTPHRWHEEAGGWSWILFEVPLEASEQAREISLQLEAYLPQTVDMKAEIWLYQD